MNKERILDLADFLENAVSDQYFSMHHWTCGTAACIGGWCEAHQMGVEPGGRIALPNYSKIDPAEVFLDLTYDQERALFYPNTTEHGASCADLPCDHPDFISRTRAVSTLRHLAETGEVVW